MFIFSLSSQHFNSLWKRSVVKRIKSKKIDIGTMRCVSFLALILAKQFYLTLLHADDYDFLGLALCESSFSSAPTSYSRCAGATSEGLLMSRGDGPSLHCRYALILATGEGLLMSRGAYTRISLARVESQMKRVSERPGSKGYLLKLP